MAGQQRDVAVALAVIGVCYTALGVAVFRYVAARTPAGIVGRLFHTRRPVTVAVYPGSPGGAWDPSQPIGHGGFYATGRAVYTLNGSTVHLRFQPKSGPAVERSATVPASLLPDTPEKRRRRVVARRVIAVYVLMGATTLAVVATATHGTTSFRLRVGAVSALAAVALSWLVTHLVLTHARHRHPDALRAVTTLRHLLVYAGGFVVVAAVLGVAFHLENLDQPRPLSWAASFASAGLLVLVSGAALTASLHHHTYVHHADHKTAH
ncbi:MAG: hypothetical protein QOD07_2307 [Frankiaceae bacterium]|nr:hypothetical protein [Frankiaceae bacterium]